MNLILSFDAHCCQMGAAIAPCATQGALWQTGLSRYL